MAVRESNELWGLPGVFTTLRCVRQGGVSRLCHLDFHLDRLFADLRTLGIPPAIQRDQLRMELNGFVRKDAVVLGHETTLVRVMMTADQFTLHARPAPAPVDFVTGKVFPYTRPMPDVKSLDYLPILEAMRELDRGREELLLVDKGGYLRETATCNLLFVVGKRIFAPCAGALPGITRRLLLQSIGDSYSIEETAVQGNDVNQFEEILCCGTGRGVVGLSAIPALSWQKRSRHTFDHLRKLYPACLKLA